MKTVIVWTKGSCSRDWNFEFTKNDTVKEMVATVIAADEELFSSPVRILSSSGGEISTTIEIEDGKRMISVIVVIW
jgi:hypothetical protein